MPSIAVAPLCHLSQYGAIALCWKDSYLSLDLNSAWGLPDGQAWNLYRWWPEPAKLQGDDIAFGSKVSFALRPFEIVLLEVVPQGQSPSLSRSFTPRPITTHFTEVSRVVDIAVTKEANDVKTAKAKSLVVTGKVPASSCGGTLVVTLQMTKGSAPHRVGGPGRFLTGKGQLAGQAITCRPVLGTATYPSCWQAWRIGVEPSAQARPFEIEITSTLPSDVELQCSSYFLPK